VRVCLAGAFVDDGCPVGSVGFEGRRKASTKGCRVHRWLGSIYRRRCLANDIQSVVLTRVAPAVSFRAASESASCRLVHPRALAFHRRWMLADKKRLHAVFVVLSAV